jgi:hypothetical protein
LADEHQRGTREEANVSRTAATQAQPPLGDLDAPLPRLPGHPVGSAAWERDQLIDRLRSLRRVLPALAQEMAAARRQAARLTIDNRRLTEQVRELRAELETRAGRAA